MEVKPPIHAQCDEALNEQTIVIEAVLEESMRWSDRGGLRETSEYRDRPIGTGIELSVISGNRKRCIKKNTNIIRRWVVSIPSPLKPMAI